jgi:hypothetical protein
MPQRWRGTMQSRPGTNLPWGDSQVQKGALLRIGFRVTRHPRRVAAGIPGGNCAGT